MIRDKLRLRELDSLRGIACLMVFFFHHSIRFVPGDNHYIFHYGYMGVQLFFMISGFVIFLTLERSNWLDFTVHRFTRLYPAYWVCVLITFFVISFSPFSQEQAPNFLLYFNLTMLQHWIGVRDLDLAYWTLNLELSFYAFMVLALISGQLKRYRVMIVVMLLPIWINKLCPQIIPDSFFNWFTFFSAAHLFGAGIIFYQVYKQTGKFLFADLLLLSWCLLTEAIVRPFNMIEFVHVAVFFFIFFLLTRNKLQWIAVPVLIFYGRISYVLYLIHENVGIEVLKLLELWNITNWYISRGILLLFFTALCYLISYYYEQPFQKFLNRTWKGVKNVGYKFVILARSI